MYQEAEREFHPLRWLSEQIGQARTELRHPRRTTTSAGGQPIDDDPLVLFLGHGNEAKPTAWHKEYRPEEAANLTETDWQLVELGVEMGEAAGELYHVQHELGLWPKDLTKKQVQEALEQDESLKDPYKPVVLGESGRLVAINPRSYPDSRIAPLFDRIQTVHGRAKDFFVQTGASPEQVAYHAQLEQSFATGEDFELAARILPTIQDPQYFLYGEIADISDETYGKYQMGAFAGRVNFPVTNRLRPSLHGIGAWWKERTGEDVPPVQMLFLDTTTIAGHPLEKEFSADSTPSQVWIRNEFGSTFFFLGSQYSAKVKERYKLARSYIDPTIAGKITPTQYAERDGGDIARHEYAHGVGMRPDYEQSLGETYALFVKELRCDAFNLAAFHGVTPSYDRTARDQALVAYFSQAVQEAQDFFRKEQGEDTREEYHVAYSIMLNRLNRARAISVRDNKLTWRDPNIVFNQITKFFEEEIEPLQLHGDAAAAEAFIDNYYSDDIFARLFSRKRNVPRILDAGHKQAVRIRNGGRNTRTMMF